MSDLMLTSVRVCCLFTEACKSSHSSRGWIWGVMSSLKWWVSVMLKLSHLLDRVLTSPILFGLFIFFFLYFNIKGCFFYKAALRFPAVDFYPFYEFCCPLCHLTSSPVFIPTAWGAGSAGWNQRAVDGWKQTDIFTWGTECTHSWTFFHLHVACFLVSGSYLKH